MTTSPTAARPPATETSVPLALRGPHADPDVALLIAPCRRPAAQFAVMQWHYSRRMPAAGKLACFGVWEHGRFVGTIIYGRGATQHIGSPYGLSQAQCVELVRIALREHEQPVTRMVAASLRQLHAACPGLQLVVSYADTGQGHHGGIYQAGNWIYTGTTSPNNASYWVRGKLVHGRTLRHLAVHRPPGETAEAFVRRTIDPNVHRVAVSAVKHRYVYPLTRTMRRRVTHMAKPYPARRTQPAPARQPLTFLPESGKDGMPTQRPVVPGSADLLTVPETDTYRERYGVIIECPTAAEQEAVYTTLRELGFSPRVVTV